MNDAWGPIYLGVIFVRQRRAFTLVELLVVIAIIGILVSLLMPAISTSRETARRSVCANNVKQLALAFPQHEAAHGFYPAGGWGWGWVGDPDMGVGIGQPGGWIYNILPYIDQKDLHDMGKGLAHGSQEKINQNTARNGIPTAITICPSRRKLQLFTYGSHGSTTDYNPGSLTVVSRADYATNGGDIGTNPGTYGIWENVGNCGNGDCGPSSFLTQAQLATIKVEVEKCMPNGIDYPLSTTNTASIKDGLSFTYLLGEKYLAPDNYYNGQSAGDNEMEFMGQNWDITRQTGPSMPPQQDRPGYDNDWLFGSAHESGFNMAFCDGSVKKISYDIDPTIHLELGVRNDGQPRNLADAMGVQ